MRPIPVPDDFLELDWVVGRVVLAGPDGDMLSDEVAPVEALIVDTELYGKPVRAAAVVLRIEPEDVGLAVIAFPGSKMMPVFSITMMDG